MRSRRSKRASSNSLKTGKMVAAIDAAHGSDFFTRMKALSWKDQNDFTHTGRLQTNSRFTREDLQIAYPEEAIAAQVNAVTFVAAILVTVFLLKTQSRTSDGERLERLVTRFRVPEQT